jgi:chromosome segregation ATPase
MTSAELQAMEKRLTDKIGDIIVEVIMPHILELKDDVAILKQDVGVLKQDVGVLKQDVGVLKQDVGTINGKIDRLDKDVLENRKIIQQMRKEMLSAKLERDDLRATDRQHDKRLKKLEAAIAS